MITLYLGFGNRFQSGMRLRDFPMAVVAEGIRGERMKEKIKMPISFHGNYVVSIIDGDLKKEDRCQKLFIKILPGKNKEESDDMASQPTHRITYFDFGCRYLSEGTLVENEVDHVSFDSKGKIYTFSPVAPKQ